MRTILSIAFLSLAFFTGANSWAQKVSMDDARQRASQFLTKSSAMSGQKKSPRRQPLMEVAEACDYYYIFNDDANGGFVIVSAEERTPDILGYSDSGYFDALHIPDNVRAWLDGYKEQIRAMAASSSRAPEVEVYPSRTPISPLLKTTWDQWYPYNLFCHEAPTGCIPTAMAQIMMYYQWPQATTATMAARPDYSQSELPAGTIIDWENMCWQYSGSETDAQKEAVAHLMAYCGQGALIKYTSDLSGGYSSNALEAFKDYFGYKSKTESKRRNEWTTSVGGLNERYSYEDWLFFIYNELRRGRPVFYCANQLYTYRNGTTGLGDGHAFVCDGYAKQDFFHINWGWGGNFDGYFRLDVLEPSEVGAGVSESDVYRANQDIFLGLEPVNRQTDASIPLAVRDMVCNTDTYSRSSIVSDFQNVAVKAYAFMTHHSELSVDYGIGLFDTNGKLLKVLSNHTRQMTVGDVQDDDEAVDFGSGLADGKYLLCAISRLNGTSTWQRDEDGAQVYVEATISGLHLTLTAINLFMTNEDIQLSSTAISIAEKPVLVAYGQLTAVATIKNSGESEYRGDIALKAISSAGNESVIATNSYTIPAGTSTTINVPFKSSALSEGNYTLYLTAGLNQSVIEGSTSSVYFANQNIHCFLNGDIYIENVNENREILDDVIRLHTVFENKDSHYTDFFGQITVRVAQKPRGSRHAEKTIKNISIPYGTSLDTLFVFDKMDNGSLEIGSQYKVELLRAMQTDDGYDNNSFWSASQANLEAESGMHLTYTLKGKEQTPEPEPEPEPLMPFTAGTPYYLYNEATGLYLCGSNMYDTQASLGEAGADLYFEPNCVTAYVNDKQAAITAIDTRFYNSQTDHYLGMVDDNVQAFMDQPSMNWRFVPQEDGTFLMSSDSEGHYLCYKEDELVLGFTTNATDRKARWSVLTKEQMTDRAANATHDEPFNLSSLISYADFGRNGKMRYYVWQGDIARGGYNDNWCAEKFDCTFDVYQVLTDMPNGAYTVTCQGFYREGADQNWNVTPAEELRRNGQEHLYALLYANEATQPIKSIFEGASQDRQSGVNTEFGWIPNNMAQAASYFRSYIWRPKNDPYLNTLKVNVTDGTIRLGIKKDQYVYRDWTIFDSFRLYYHGTTPWKEQNDGIASVAINDRSFDVYTLSGVTIRHHTTTLSDLPAGIYVVCKAGQRSGGKVVVR